MGEFSKSSDLFKARAYQIKEKGWTAVDTELIGVTADMIDWFWVNMEKGFVLWHPQDHVWMKWLKEPEADNPIGSIHDTFQISGGADNPEMVAIYEKAYSAKSPDEKFLLKMIDVSELPKDVQDYISMEHVVVITGVNSQGISMSYRVHEYERSDCGVRTRTTAVPTEEGNKIFPNLDEDYDLKVWAVHGMGEITSYPSFLPELYKMWLPVKNRNISRRFSFKVERDENGILHYVKEDTEGAE